MSSTLLAKIVLRQALVVGARGPAFAARAAGVGSTGSSRGLSWVKDVTVNVTFINHEVRVMCVCVCVGKVDIYKASISHSRLPLSPPTHTYQGLRITVPGRVGQSLLDVAQMHDIELESGCGGGGAVQQKKHSERWTEDLFGRGK